MKRRTVVGSVVVLLVLAGTAWNAHGQIPAVERSALIALYESTDGDQWTNNSGWKDEPHHDDGFALPGTEGGWYRILLAGAEEEKHVDQILLSGNNLNGTIPAQIGNLSSLRYLYLQNNQLAQNIPATLANLANLRGLFCQNNQLTGNIPAELGNLSNLQQLHLYNNQFTGGIPSALGNLGNLRDLRLQLNGFTGNIPVTLGNLSKLEILYLHNNRLAGQIPSVLGNYSNLKFFFLSTNRLTGSIPSSFLNLTKLTLNPNSFLIGYNGVFTDDEDLRTFLHGLDPGWEDTQTVPPVNVSAQGVSHASIEVSWTPVTYTADPGGYLVSYSMDSGGPYTTLEPTEDKLVSQKEVTGLMENTTYFFVVQTRTDPHPNNENTVDSVYSGEVSALTLIRGDADCNGVLGLSDAVLVLQVLNGVQPSESLCAEADANEDGKIGMEDDIYILQKIAGLKQ